jgi:DNA (cytosine-5)-methyltransferase 1
MSHLPRFRALEFFAGGGLARLGLKASFDVIWANDNDAAKADAYRANFGARGFVEGDIASLTAVDLPAGAHLAWASFPCQDLSLAGARQGLSATRSGTFFAFVDLIAGLKKTGSAPPILVIENVRGLLSASQGRDFAALLEALRALGYRCGCLEIDAVHFVPQSRPRVFVVCVAADTTIPKVLLGASPFLTPAICKAYDCLSPSRHASLLHWALPPPEPRSLSLADMIEDDACCWWSEPKTQALLDQVSLRHQVRIEELRRTGQAHLGALYRRIRMQAGQKVQRAEVRFDGIAGCLRTPAGGSSRQMLLRIEGSTTKARALTAREAMTLMGVPADYRLPKTSGAGLKIAGDGVVVPVVAHLTQHLLAPLAASLQDQFPTSFPIKQEAI